VLLFLLQLRCRHWSGCVGLNNAVQQHICDADCVDLLVLLPVYRIWWNAGRKNAVLLACILAWTSNICQQVSALTHSYACCPAAGSRQRDDTACQSSFLHTYIHTLCWLDNVLWRFIVIVEGNCLLAK